MAGTVIKGQHNPTKKQEELLERVDSPETRRHINKIIAEAAEKYVPNDGEGKLAKKYTARVDGIIYHQPYARYQYYGKTMGPNIAIFNRQPPNGDGAFSRWWTRPGTTKHLNGGTIGDGKQFVDKYGTPFYTRHYTTLGTGRFWIQEMWKHDSRVVQNKITRYLKGLDIER